MKLKDKVAIITGGASGIGLACAKKFLESGAKVVLVDWNENISDIAKSLGDENEIIGLRVDISKDEQIKNMVDKTVETFGKVDIAVANAGVGDAAVCHEEAMEQWDKVIGINLTGVFLTNKYVIDQFIKQNTGGSILNMASILGFVGTTGAVAYCSAKGGVVNLTRNVAVSYAKQGIRVNAIAPGYVYTPILNGMTKEMEQALIQAHPIGRLGNPEEVANAVTFLVSDDASFITGAILPVDGGYLAQ